MCYVDSESAMWFVALQKGSKMMENLYVSDVFLITSNAMICVCILLMTNLSQGNDSGKFNIFIMRLICSKAMYLTTVMWNNVITIMCLLEWI